MKTIFRSDANNPDRDILPLVSAPPVNLRRERADFRKAIWHGIGTGLAFGVIVAGVIVHYGMQAG